MTTTSPCAGSTTTAAKSAPAAHCSCTELECFEKPRFFCGQLLTDVDLQATVDYVAAKNRLHNRYVVGTGVVCGLAVRCDPCNSGSVVVEAGYAIDCSGNDVIVCSETTFDAKGYIDRRKKEKQADCSTRRAYVPADCDSLQTEYCLVVSYEEKPGKPINALVRDNGCKANRCEPSRTLERFRFDLIDKMTAEKLNVRPSAWSLMSECLKQESAKLAAYRSELAKATTEQQLQGVYVRLRADLLDFARRSGLTHCDLIEKICAIEWKPSTSQPTTPVTPENPTGGTGTPAAFSWTDGSNPVVSITFDQLTGIYSQLLADCACNALLVPCPPCCDTSDYVLLACLKIVQGKVVSICNTVRTQVITGPAVRHWMQPLFDGIGRFFESVCCPEPAAATQPQTDVGLVFTEMESAGRVASSFGSSFVRSAGMVSGGARPLQLFRKPLADVERRLAELPVQITVTRAATVEDAYRCANLCDLASDIPAGSRVELVVAPDDTVAAIRVLKDGHS